MPKNNAVNLWCSCGAIMVICWCRLNSMLFFIQKNGEHVINRWCTFGALLVHFWCTFKNHYILSKKHVLILKNTPKQCFLVKNDVILKLHQKCTKSAPKVHHQINQFCPHLHHQYTNNLTNVVMQASFKCVICLKASLILARSLHASCINIIIVIQAGLTHAKFLTHLRPEYLEQLLIILQAWLTVPWNPRILGVKCCLFWKTTVR